MKDKTELAIKLKKLRKEKGVSSEIVATELGLKGSTYRRYEINTMPKINTCIALANYFGVSLEYLMDNGVDNNDTEYCVASSANYNVELNEISELSEEEKLFIRKLRTISEDDLKDVFNYLNEKKSIK